MEELAKGCEARGQNGEWDCEGGGHNGEWDCEGGVYRDCWNGLLPIFFFHFLPMQNELERLLELLLSPLE